ncbi:TauD/TfdA dioxygenase family protein [Candidatus Methylocalor cossyra]|uniref:Alpha-ketoglutarate-dependent sulfate ester dioxygenase n=1 Tax=Candidatus Methylocalor cossyra TaxID=3108543 RepID=A0ABP1C869_9GAMM
MTAISHRPATKACLDIRPLAPSLGAEIHGVTLAGDLPPATVEAIRQAIFRYKVVFFRGQHHLDDRGQEAFARLLGPIAPHPTASIVEGTETIQNFDAKDFLASFWHTDVTFIDRYPQFSVLRGVVIPPLGGDTVWANTVAAYGALPRELQALADRLWALHTNDREYPGRQANGVPLERLLRDHAKYETEQPLVQIHPYTGERALILGDIFRRFIGYDGETSDLLFRLFQRYITRLENTVRWRWAEGDVAVWDNRATQHRALDDFGAAPRIVRRVLVPGEPGIGVDGRRSVTRRKPEALAA